MKKYRIISLVLAAVIAAVPFTGCSNGKDNSSSEASNKQEGLAQTEIIAEIEEEKESNETVFKLNKVIDSGKTDEEGNRYLYLDAVITNNTEKEYELNILNNFYILFPDGEEVHFDVRTQLYGQNNMDNYIPNPFKLTSKGEISGIIGGFIVPPDKNNFTVCFFPTQDVMTDKESVIKVVITADNIEKIVQPQ
ncbi:MAG: DUF4352 domain-containing protein [Ruminococcus sp.]|nr:DUF4352 domain-containing protein [Ruminococcus sp.]